jgi:flavodoxin I
MNRIPFFLMTIGLYFGTQTGKTETVCGIIKEQLGDAVSNAKDVTESDLADFAGFDGLICGIPTWNTGAEELRSGTAWDDLLEKIGALDLKGKPVAIFGLGDSVGYGQDYVDAMEELHRYFEKAGAKMVGYVSLDGYDQFTSSRCLIPHLNEITAPEDGEKFCGLPVDEDSENEKTAERVENWCAQLKTEMGI